MRIPSLPSLRLADLKTHRFLVEIPDLNSISLVGFRSVQGLDVSIPPIAVEEPALTEPYYFAGSKGQTVISLERGLDFDGGLTRWIEDVQFWRPGNRNYRKDISIYFLHESYSRFEIGVQVSRGFDLFGAFPINWIGPVGNSLRGDLVVERVQLIVSRIEPTPISSGVAILNLI